jgi:hypothetical protein
MKRDPGGGGTDASGARTDEYCSYCYQDGAFSGPAMSAAEMQAFCIEKLREQGVPRPLGWLLTRSIPKLKRWRATA